MKDKKSIFELFDVMFENLLKPIKLKPFKVKIPKEDNKVVESRYRKMFKFNPKIKMKSIAQNGAEDKPNTYKVIR